jgi:hypothetical protein
MLDVRLLIEICALSLCMELLAVVHGLDDREPTRRPAATA